MSVCISFVHRTYGQCSHSEGLSLLMHLRVFVFPRWAAHAIEGVLADAAQVLKEATEFLIERSLKKVVELLEIVEPWCGGNSNNKVWYELSLGTVVKGESHEAKQVPAPLDVVLGMAKNTLMKRSVSQYTGKEQELDQRFEDYVSICKSFAYREEAGLGVRVSLCRQRLRTSWTEGMLCALLMTGNKDKKELKTKTQAIKSMYKNERSVWELVEPSILGRGKAMLRLK